MAYPSIDDIDINVIGNKTEFNDNVYVYGDLYTESIIGPKLDIDIGGGVRLTINSNGDSTFFNNVDIRGKLNIVGISTFTDDVDIQANLNVGSGSTFRDITVTGIATFGSSTTVINGTTDTINVGTALTLGHSPGLQFHTQDLHAQGFEVNQINASGIITASSFRGDGSQLTGLDAGGLKQTKFISANLVSGNISITTGYTEILSLTITPTSASSKIVILSSMVGTAANTGGNLFALASVEHKLTRTVGGSETTLIEGSFSHQRDNVNATKFMQSTSSINLQDSPATTSAVTYKLFAKRGSNSNSGNIRQQHMVLLETAV